MKLCDGLFVLPLFVLLLIMYSNALQIPSYERSYIYVLSPHTCSAILSVEHFIYCPPRCLLEKCCVALLCFFVNAFLI